MKNKIAKTFTRIMALCMALLAVSMHTGITVNAKQGIPAQQEQDYTAKQDAATDAYKYKHMTYSEYSDIYVYGLRDHRTYGVASGNASNDTRIDMEGLYGIRVDMSGDKPVYSIYKHTSAVLEEAEITLYEVKDKKPVKVKSFGNASVNKELPLSYSFKNNRVYYLGAEFTIPEMEDPQTAYAYLYYDAEDGLMTCRLPSWAAEMDAGITRWEELLKDTDPEDCLSNDKITYPTSGTNGSVTHVKQWEDISDTLVLKDDWNDETIVFAFVDYLSKNIAYDDYRVSQPKNRSRASIAGDYTKDKYFTLENNVGVCWDYVNILTIMCRHHGIPCTSVENARHTINAVWLDGEWVGIDLTELAKYKCGTEDTDKENWTRYLGVTWMHYGTYGENNIFDTVGESIWTREKGLGIK